MTSHPLENLSRESRLDHGGSNQKSELLRRKIRLILNIGAYLVAARSPGCLQLVRSLPRKWFFVARPFSPSRHDISAANMGGRPTH